MTTATCRQQTPCFAAASTQARKRSRRRRPCAAMFYAMRPIGTPPLLYIPDGLYTGLWKPIQRLLLPQGASRTSHPPLTISHTTLPKPGRTAVNLMA